MLHLIGTTNILLEAEVSPNSQGEFEKKYNSATGDNISPGNPTEYQIQDNKWGAELRIYFNDTGLAATLSALGFHVEERVSGYRSGNFRFRINSRELWWKLVENGGFKLGSN